MWFKKYIFLVRIYSMYKMKKKEKEIICSVCLNALVLAILKGDSAC